MSLSSSTRAKLKSQKTWTMDETRYNYSPLVWVQALSFVAGLALVVASTVVHEPYLQLTAGILVAISGLLTLVGIRVTFGGPLGGVLRAALGSTPVVRVYLRAAFWILMGLAVAAWGVWELRTARPENPPFWQEPITHLN